MAQGFIKPSTPAQSLEDTGYGYFEDLLWRSFFQEVRKHPLGMETQYCKMHDLMHDLAVQVAGTECTILCVSEGEIDRNTRHVSFDFHLGPSWKLQPRYLKQKRSGRFFCLVNHLDKGIQLVWIFICCKF